MLGQLAAAPWMLEVMRLLHRWLLKACLTLTVGCAVRKAALLARMAAAAAAATMAILVPCTATAADGRHWRLQDGCCYCMLLFLLLAGLPGQHPAVLHGCCRPQLPSCVRCICWRCIWVVKTLADVL